MVPNAPATNGLYGLVVRMLLATSAIVKQRVQRVVLLSRSRVATANRVDCVAARACRRRVEVDDVMLHQLTR